MEGGHEQLVEFLTSIGMGSAVAPLFSYGIETMDDMEYALTRLPLKICALILQATGITARQWMVIRRSYFTHREWCQQSFLVDGWMENGLNRLLQIIIH